jgi:hypothetical protein
MGQLLSDAVYHPNHKLSSRLVPESSSPLAEHWYYRPIPKDREIFLHGILYVVNCILELAQLMDATTNPLMLSDRSWL